MNPEPTIFTQIINHQIPSDIVFENDRIIVIKTQKPHAPIHYLGITKQPFYNLHDLLQSEDNKDLLWELFHVLSELATKEGIDQTGYKLTTNIGKDAGQTVYHLHVHMLGGKQLQE